MNQKENIEIKASQTHQIEWVYWDKIIKINTFKVQNNNKIVINIHGTFWSLKGWNNKYLTFLKATF